MTTNQPRYAVQDMFFSVQVWDMWHNEVIERFPAPIDGNKGDRERAHTQARDFADYLNKYSE